MSSYAYQPGARALAISSAVIVFAFSDGLEAPLPVVAELHATSESAAVRLNKSRFILLSPVVCSNNRKLRRPTPDAGRQTFPLRENDDRRKRLTTAVHLR